MQRIQMTSSIQQQPIQQQQSLYVTIHSSDGFSFVVSKEVASVSGKRKKQHKIQNIKIYNI
jgi:hypothetical protein